MADKTDKKPGFVARAKNAVKNFAAGVAKSSAIPEAN